MLMVIAKLKVVEDKREAFEALARELAVLVRDNEPGCLMYQWCREKEGGYVVVERYKDKAALAAHSSSEHFQAFAPKLGACLSSPMDAQVLKELQ